jgi:hypothetical protein
VVGGLERSPAEGGLSMHRCKARRRGGLSVKAFLQGAREGAAQISGRNEKQRDPESRKNENVPSNVS